MYMKKYLWILKSIYEWQVLRFFLKKNRKRKKLKFANAFHISQCFRITKIYFRVQRQMEL